MSQRRAETTGARPEPDAARPRRNQGQQGWPPEKVRDGNTATRVRDHQGRHLRATMPTAGEGVDAMREESNTGRDPDEACRATPDIRGGVACFRGGGWACPSYWTISGTGAPSTTS